MGLDNPLHIAFLVVILLLVFGARRLPEIGRSLGSSMREFKQAISDDTPQPTLTAGSEQPKQPAQAQAAEQAPTAERAPTAEQTPTAPDYAAEQAPAQPDRH